MENPSGSKYKNNKSVRFLAPSHMQESQAPFKITSITTSDVNQYEGLSNTNKHLKQVPGYATSSTATESHSLTHRNQTRNDSNNYSSNSISPARLVDAHEITEHSSHLTARLPSTKDTPINNMVGDSSGNLIQPSADLLDFLELRQSVNTWLQISRLRNQSRHLHLQQYVAAVLEEFEDRYRGLEDRFARKLFPL